MKYQRMNQTRKEIIILDEWVEMTWTQRNRKKYVALGYEFTGSGDSFWCHIDDAPSSSTRVVAKCPCCGDERELYYHNIIQAGHTLCNGCARRSDLSGQVFGRLTAIDVDHNDKSGRVAWVCECECGETKTVWSEHLVSGETRSCGCLVRDIASSRKGATHPSWKGGEITLICKQCGEEYSKPPSVSERSNFCSNKCWGRWMSDNWTGENNPGWNPNTTRDQRLRSRNYPEYRQYVKAVMERDDYTCCVCGKRGDKMQVHHLYSYSDYPEYQLNVDFGRTICEGEHNEFHLWMGHNRVPCEPRDFEIWLMTKKKK